MGIIRDIFGPSQQEIWQELCKEIGAEFTSGGFWGGNKVIARVKQWSITLDTYTVSNGKTSSTYTRIRAPYVNPDGFQFKIYRSGIFSGIGKHLGMQDIIVGYPEFDDEFIIKGNNEEKVRELFANDKIRILIEQQPNINFMVKDDEGFWKSSFPQGVDELYFEVVGVIKDIDRLKSLYSLFAEVLNHLCYIGSAYEDNPNITL